MKVQHWKPSEMRNIIFEIYVDNVWCYEKKKHWKIGIHQQHPQAISSSNNTLVWWILG